MPLIEINAHKVFYELHGPDDGPVYVLVNGLTQYSALWHPYRDALATAGFRVATFDLLGQGQSDKPELFIDQDDQVALLDGLVITLSPGGTRPVFLAGISFGGVIALRYAIEHGDRLAGLVPMSTFAALSPQLMLLGSALREGLILGGVGYLQDLLLPMNVSSEWLAPRLGSLDAVKRPGWLINDAYALQNLMELFLDFEPMTERLASIRLPTMILNGELDFLTPRALHETIRANIADSALVLIPRAYHAFTLEKPALTAWLLTRFAQDVLAGKWHGGGSVWIAPEEAGGTIEPFPSGFDHLRSLPAPILKPVVRQPGAAAPPARRAARARAPARKPAR